MLHSLDASLEASRGLLGPSATHPHMYHTPTHRSQTGPLSAGYGTVSAMATYNGYMYFFLDTPKYGPRGVVERQKRRTDIRYIQ